MYNLYQQQIIIPSRICITAIFSDIYNLHVNEINKSQLVANFRFIVDQSCTSKMHFTQIILLSKTITSAEEETTPVNLMSMCQVCKLRILLILRMHNNLSTVQRTYNYCIQTTISWVHIHTNISVVHQITVHLHWNTL